MKRINFKQKVEESFKIIELVKVISIKTGYQERHTLLSEDVISDLKEIYCLINSIINDSKTLNDEILWKNVRYMVIDFLYEELLPFILKYAQAIKNFTNIEIDDRSLIIYENAILSDFKKIFEKLDTYLKCFQH